MPRLPENRLRLARRDRVVLLDPIAPSEDDTAFWARLDALPPTVVAILKPDHVRDVDVDVFVERYGARAYGCGSPSGGRSCSPTP